MASVFLSYSREDAAKAKSIATALERAAHEVWWDRHIPSGSEFAGAIEEALKRADTVLVLWSKDSVGSPWVRDEAAEGRDTGRLIPVVIDDSRPPIGFRQFQSFDLSGWSGRGPPKRIDELLTAIEEKGCKAPVVAPKPAFDKASYYSGRKFRTLALFGLIAAAVILAGAWFYWTRIAGRAAAIPTLAVLPFADLSPGRDKAYFSEGVAEEILSVLARDPGIRVIGRSSSRQYQEGSADLQGIRNALGVTHVLEGSARTSGDELRMSVRLINAVDGRQVWAEDYNRRLSNIFAVQAEIGRAVAQRLSGSLSQGVRQAGPQATAVDAYTKYLAARAKMRERTEPALNQALQLAKQVLAADPNYAPGHALYAELLWLLSDDNYGNMPVEQAWKVAKVHADRAVKLAPERPEGYAALGVVPPPESASAALRKAIELDPSRSELRLWLAAVYNHLGKHEEGLQKHREAAEMEPIWAPAIRNYAQNLAGSGRYEEAERVVQQFESRGGAPIQAALIRSQAAWMRGDLSEGVRYSEIVLQANPELLSASPTQPFLYHDLGLFERAKGLARKDPRLLLYVSGNYRALAEKVRSEGLWGKTYPSVSLDAVALTRDWATIADLYDARPGPRRDICWQSDGPGMPLHFATALKAKGRAKEATELVKCAKQRIAIQAKGSIRSAYYPEMYLAALSAQALAIEGNGSAALQEMNRAFRLGFWTPLSGLAYHPALDPYRNAPQYRELDARFKRRTALERQQVLQQERNEKGG